MDSEVSGKHFQYNLMWCNTRIAVIRGTVDQDTYRGLPQVYWPGIAYAFHLNRLNSPSLMLWMMAKMYRKTLYWLVVSTICYFP
jgi:hypothetical protein